MESCVRIRSNIPEKIIFCIDLSSEVGKPFQNGNDPRTKLHFIMSAIRRFVRIKNKINPAHEYAIICCTDHPLWYSDFTSDAEQVVQRLDALIAQEDCNQFDLSMLFETISQRVELEKEECVRVIFVYARSAVKPTVSDQKLLDRIYALQCLTVDVLYVHDRANSSNCPQEVYDILSNDLKQESYVCETTVKKRLLEVMAMLLAHPFQRVPQQYASYDLGLMADDWEMVS
eukprot:Colp12_sorted_trinity150504_noHs@20261